MESIRMVEINGSSLETSNHKDCSFYDMGIDYRKTLGAKVYHYALNKQLPAGVYLIS